MATFPGYFTAEPYYDIARVEILRGPQGTFVGQNATGGAVFVTSNNPVIGGGYHGYVAGPDRQLQRSSARKARSICRSAIRWPRASPSTPSTRDSFYDITGPYTGDDGVHTASGRVSACFGSRRASSRCCSRPTTTTSIFGAYPADPVNRDRTICSTSPPTPTSMRATVRALGPARSTTSSTAASTLRSVTGYQKGNTVYRADLDGTSAGNNTFRDSVDETIWSQEVNLISPDDGRFTWILGAYYQHDELRLPAGRVRHRRAARQRVHEYVLEGTNPKETAAVFGQVGFDLPTSSSCRSARATPNAAPTNDVNVNQYGTADRAASRAQKFDESLRQGRR